MNGHDEATIGETCGMNRRTALRLMALGVAGVGLSHFDGVLAQVAPALPKAGTAVKAAKAKAIIQIWMWGGPGHLDTFDPKPEAGYDFAGPLKAVGTNVAGIQVCELLPLLAQQADKYSIIRSMTHGNNGHETAAYMVQTGRSPQGSLVYPCAGAVVSLMKGYDHGYNGLIPPYVVLTRPQGRFSESGFLGPRYKPFATGGDPNARRFEVEGVITAGMPDERQHSRRELLRSLDTLGQAMAGNAQFERLDKTEEQAYDLILGDGAKLFDLGQEKPEQRDRYGRNTFGQSCLMARRLVESGVPYVTINYGGWDTHKQNFEIMRRRLPEMDRAMSALLADLSDRGLLESTIVWWGGEFGRQPRVDYFPPWNGGRGHWGKCFCHVVAGGGFKGGHVVGKSDDKGEDVAERPVSPQDLIGSMYELMGLNPATPLPNPRGLDVTLLPPAGEGFVKSDGPLKEIM